MSISWVYDKPNFSWSSKGNDSCVKGMVRSYGIDIEKFNGYTFELWMLKMKDLLIDKE